MPIYAQHTVSSVFVGPTGHQHNRAVPDDGQPFAIECAACEPFLVKEGWVYNPELVPLTDIQERERDRVEREGNLAVKQVAERLAEAAAHEIRGAAEKPKRTLTPEQLAAMAEGRRKAAANKG